ncbi:MAG: hypothetical protein ACYCV5_04300 [Acidimicrobiales bacterium]
MGSQRFAIGYLLLGLLTAAAIAGAALGAVMSPGPSRARLDQAVRATERASAFSAVIDVHTDLNGLAGGAGSEVATTYRTDLTVSGAGKATSVTSLDTVSRSSRQSVVAVSAVGSTLTVRQQDRGGASVATVAERDAAHSLVEPIRHELQAILTASGVQSRGATYSFTAPALSFAAPGVPGGVGVPHLPAYDLRHGEAAVSVTIGGGVVRSVTVDLLFTPSYQTQHLVFTAVHGSGALVARHGEPLFG